MLTPELPVWRLAKENMTDKTNSKLHLFDELIKKKHNYRTVSQVNTNLLEFRNHPTSSCVLNTTRVTR